MTVTPLLKIVVLIIILCKKCVKQAKLLIKQFATSNYSKSVYYLIKLEQVNVLTVWPAKEFGRHAGNGVGDGVNNPQYTYTAVTFEPLQILTRNFMRLMCDCFSIHLSHCKYYIT